MGLRNPDTYASLSVLTSSMYSFSAASVSLPALGTQGVQSASIFSTTFVSEAKLSRSAPSLAFHESHLALPFMSSMPGRAADQRNTCLSMQQQCLLHALQRLPVQES